MRRSKLSDTIKELLQCYPNRIDAVRYDRYRRLLWIVTADDSEVFLIAVAEFIRQRLPRAEVEHTSEFVPMVLIYDVDRDPRPELRNIRIYAGTIFDMD